MIDLSHIGQYHENNRIEAKKALGGLPRSIWETYSAFANTLGGVILLGVEEHADHSLHTVNLPDPERLVREFWEMINTPNKVSVNILTQSQVRIETVDGDRIIAITVPRAQRYDRPVYIDGNPMTGSYRRSGEGDYRCTAQEVEGMLRDAAAQTQDMRVLEGAALDGLDWESVGRYRARAEGCRPGHPWQGLEDTAFLEQLGAAGAGGDGAIHPTAAGLLLFGREREIVRAFPAYSLEYRDRTGNGREILSASGDWSGNLFDFYFRVRAALARGIPGSGRPGEGEDREVSGALGEAVANSLINADYWGSGGIRVVREAEQVTISNPGGFRIGVDAARSGGVSDPRNGALSRMFNRISIGASTGSGIPNIYSVWKRRGWTLPVIEERFAPERTVLTLPLRGSGRRDAPVPAGCGAERNPVGKQMIIEYLTEHPRARAAEIGAYIELEPSCVREDLEQLIRQEIVSVEEDGEGRMYRLKS